MLLNDKSEPKLDEICKIIFEKNNEIDLKQKRKGEAYWLELGIFTSIRDFMGSLKIVSIESKVSDQ